MADSKPNSDRRVEGEEGAGAHQEGPNSVQAGQTQRRGSGPDAIVGDQEPGPYDDDGLPENARRRVPS